jgi:hypothetical protein
VCRGSEAGPSARSSRNGRLGSRSRDRRGWLRGLNGGRRGGLLGLLRLSSLLSSGGLGLSSGSFLSRGHSSSRSVLCNSGLGSLGGGFSFRCLRRGLLLDGLLELLVDLDEVLLALGYLLLALLLCLSRRISGGRSGLDHAAGDLSLLLRSLLILGLVGEIAEDVVQNKVTVGLLGKNKGLHEPLVRLALVGDLTDDLDDDVGVGALRVDVGNADLGVVEVEVLDALINGLGHCQSHTRTPQLCN